MPRFPDLAHPTANTRPPSRTRRAATVTLQGATLGTPLALITISFLSALAGEDFLGPQEPAVTAALASLFTALIHAVFPNDPR